MELTGQGSDRQRLPIALARDVREAVRNVAAGIQRLPLVYPRWTRGIGGGLPRAETVG